MSSHQAKLVVPYTSAEMFDLVIDVEHYPEFLPGYLDARILRREDAKLYVEQRVGLGIFSATFHSFAHYEPAQRIEIRSVEKPFEALEIQWLFDSVAAGCAVSFQAKARFGDGVTARLLQPWFDQLAALVPAAFVRRARALYGDRPVGPM